MQVERGLRRAPYPGHHPAIEAGQLGIVIRDLLLHHSAGKGGRQTELSGVGNTTPTLRGSSTLNWESNHQHKPVQMGVGAVTQEQIFITTRRTPAMPGPAAFLGHSPGHRVTANYT